jgi:hypothetical protein
MHSCGFDLFVDIAHEYVIPAAHDKSNSIVEREDGFLFRGAICVPGAPSMA